MTVYAKDPKTGQYSVSLTILWISVVFLITMGVLQALGKVQDINMSMEFFGISSGLYFGRRVNFSKDSAQVESADKENS